MGAPEMKAAGRISSLPSWIRFGTGVNVLAVGLASAISLELVGCLRVRGGLVGGDVIVGLVGAGCSRDGVGGLRDRTLEASGRGGQGQTRGRSTP